MLVQQQLWVPIHMGWGACFEAICKRSGKQQGFLKMPSTMLGKRGALKVKAIYNGQFKAISGTHHI